LQADSVEHAGCGFVEPRRRIARHGFFGQSLDHEAAELVEVDDVLKLNPVTEGAAGSYDGILELDSGKGNGEVRSARAGCRGGGHRGCSLPRGAGASKVVLELRGGTRNAKEQS